jgi:pyrroline-5-carboxylate reductase
MKSTIAFIGGGNMAASLVGGLLAAACPASNLLVSEPDSAKCSQLEQQFGIRTSTDNRAALDEDVVVLAVKPQILQSVCRSLADTIGGRTPLFISIAAGVRSHDIERWLGGDRAIVRCMPNTPALLQCGATGLAANSRVSVTQKQLAEQILQAVGMTLWVEDEDQLDAVTAVSGSGPAYFFLLMEAMQAAGETLGLRPEAARALTLQTALGAARMASQSDVDPATLRARVTSKGGTTEQAILSFENAGFQQMVQQALDAACTQSRNLANALGKDSV